MTFNDEVKTKRKEKKKLNTNFLMTQCFCPVSCVTVCFYIHFSGVKKGTQDLKKTLRFRYHAARLFYQKRHFKYFKSDRHDRLSLCCNVCQCHDHYGIKINNIINPNTIT